MITRQDGSVWASGRNTYGELGIDTKSDSVTDFVTVFSDVANAIATGGAHSIVLKQDGSVWATGRNHYGQLGDGSTTNSPHFIEVVSEGVKAVAAGLTHTIVVKEDDSVWVVGCNSHGQLGIGSEVDRHTFIEALVLEYGVKDVVAGAVHTLVLGIDGTMWAAGSNRFGQLGITSMHSPSQSFSDTDSMKEVSASKNSFVKVLFTNTKAIAAGSYHSMVLKEDDSVWVMGNNEFGQLGDGSPNSRTMRRAIKGEEEFFNAKAVAAGLYHSVVLEVNGDVWSTGGNEVGQLEFGSKTSKRAFVLVSSGVQAVAAGGWHSIVQKQDDSFWAVGRNNYGQLGDGSKIDRTEFVRLMQISDGGTYIIGVSLGNFSWRQDFAPCPCIIQNTPVSRVYARSSCLSISALAN